MKPVRGVILLIVASFASAALGSSAAAQRGQGFVFSLGEKHAEHAFDVADGGTLRINMPEIRFINADNAVTVNISIHTGSADLVEVGIAFVSGRMEWARRIVRSIKLSATTSGTTVIIEPLADLVSFEQPSWAHRLTLFIEVRIPEDFNVSVFNYRGEVSLERLNGSAILESVTGDITVGAVRGAEASISTQSGSISADLLEVEEGVVTSTRGDIEIGTLRGEMYAAAVAGDVRVLRAEGARTTLKSSKGDIWLGIRQLAATTLVAGNGDISIHAPASIAANVYFEGDDVRVDGVFGLDAAAASTIVRGTINGGGIRLEAMGSGGTIRLLLSASGS